MAHRTHHSNKSYKFSFKTPTALDGVASLFDFNGVIVSRCGRIAGAEAESKALARDWAAVGKDMRSAIAKYEERKSA